MKINFDQIKTYAGHAREALDILDSALNDPKVREAITEHISKLPQDAKDAVVDTLVDVAADPRTRETFKKGRAFLRGIRRRNQG